MHSIEVNFDGLVGPTHNYAGLSIGNVASTYHAQQPSNPKYAALQGLAKMRTMLKLGLAQGILPPHERPAMHTLRQLGFTGAPAQMLEQVYQTNPRLLAAVASASAMWVANAATVSPSTDTADKRVHFTPANLINKFHRSLESDTTGRILRAVFPNDKFFAHHLPLPSHDMFSDEGAANHLRLCHQHETPGINLFIYGHTFSDKNRPSPQQFPARQTYEASQAIARLHGLRPERTHFIQQNPAIIDQGVFHNDVIAVGNENVLFYHQHAFLSAKRIKHTLEQQLNSENIIFIAVSDSEISISDAVKSYLFNSQPITLPDHRMALIAPIECQSHPIVSRYLATLLTQQTPIKQVVYMDLRQSMQNGGGPACLRLRAVLTPAELNAVNPHCLLTEAKINRLEAWVNKYYRDRLALDELRDPALLQESYFALDKLTQLLQIGHVYPFQQ
ncbi:MAG: N-succinylarginine dihydrolase [Plesiomonas sp.]|uniref:N-succinylarginine dihydrolase n=1 Tax=Plesiomonas sp. TaxID=2486279 RepID=UPI003F361976